MTEITWSQCTALPNPWGAGHMVLGRAAKAARWFRRAGDLELCVDVPALVSADTDLDTGPH